MKTLYIVLVPIYNVTNNYKKGDDPTILQVLLQV